MAEAKRAGIAKPKCAMAARSAAAWQTVSIGSGVSMWKGCLKMGDDEPHLFAS